MKVCCDFLPGEHKAVRRNLKLVFATVIAWILTVMILVYKEYDYRGRLKEIGAQVTNQEATIEVLEGQINAVRYPQDTIKELIQKFRFIQQAMGSDDYPFLEFFQALETSVPVNRDTGFRRIAVTELKKGSGATWSLQGTATHWDDILTFQDNLSESTFNKPIDGTDKRRKKKNFRSVRVFKVENKDNGVTFQMEFEFITD